MKHGIIEGDYSGYLRDIREHRNLPPVSVLPVRDENHQHEMTTQKKKERQTTPKAVSLSARSAVTSRRSPPFTSYTKNVCIRFACR